MRYKFIVCKVLEREAYYCAARSVNSVDVYVMEQGLHERPEELFSEVQKQLDVTVDIQGREYDAALLGYGLCSNGIVGLSAKIPIVAVRGHDCMTLLLGSRQRYKEYFDSHRGIYWYSGGWIENNLQPGKERYERTLAEYKQKYGEENAEYLMEVEGGWLKEYSWATFIDTGLGPAESYRKFTKECAEYLGWNYDKLKGDLSLMEKLVDGEWDEEDFLVAKAGQKIVADLTKPELIEAE